MIDRLVALCSPARVSDGVPEIGALAPLLAAAEQHDVTGQAVAALLAQGSDRLPPDLREGLVLYREGMRLEARRADAQLAELLALLASRGLPAMPFKGPLLAHAGYPDPTLRSCTDLDVMVHPDDVDHVLACLREAGFVHQRGLGDDGIAWTRRYGSEYILYRPDGLPVEPHWRPAPRNFAFDIDLEALWRLAQPTSFLGADCYLPAPGDHLLLLALHGAKARWHKLKWVVDIAAYLSAHPDLDLAGLRAAAARQGLRRVLDLAVALSHRLCAVPHDAPPSDAMTTRLVADVVARLARSTEGPDGRFYDTFNPFLWRLRERFRDRSRYAARTLLMPRLAHWRRLNLPPRLRWLYPPLKLPWDHLLTPTLRLGRRAATWSRSAAAPHRAEPR
jgi:hypothetical protein